MPNKSIYQCFWPPSWAFCKTIMTKSCQLKETSHAGKCKHIFSTNITSSWKPKLVFSCFTSTSYGSCSYMQGLKQAIQDIKYWRQETNVRVICSYNNLVKLTMAVVSAMKKARIVTSYKPPHNLQQWLLILTNGRLHGCYHLLSILRKITTQK